MAQALARVFAGLDVALQPALDQRHCNDGIGAVARIGHLCAEIDMRGMPSRGCTARSSTARAGRALIAAIACSQLRLLCHCGKSRPWSRTCGVYTNSPPKPSRFFALPLAESGAAETILPAEPVPVVDVQRERNGAVAEIRGSTATIASDRPAGSCRSLRTCRARSAPSSGPGCAPGNRRTAVAGDVGDRDCDEQCAPGAVHVRPFVSASAGWSSQARPMLTATRCTGVAAAFGLC